MLGSVVCGILVLMGLLSGGIEAGEDDYLAMRGGAADGKTHVNLFQMNWQPAAAKPLDSAIASADRVLPEAQFASGGYLAWKNSCVQMPSVVVGQLVVPDQPEGFGQIAPYVTKGESEELRFLEILAEKLTE
ncbi:MAG: hypothetical protein LIP77_09455 [Planctomycetes bacterium]|nr:hypothetical protein [Planctomycetota bacterium]